MNDISERPSAAQLIRKYIECRNSIALLNDQHEKKIRPYREGMELIEGLLAEDINRLEGQSIKTKDGTAYRSTTTSFRVADRVAWLDWVIHNNHRDMLTTNVAKEAVKEYVDNNGGKLPPGLNMTTVYKILVRTSSEE